VLNGAIPSFDVEGGLLLVLVRGLTDVGLLSASGTLIFWGLLLPGVSNGIAVINEQLLVLSRASLALALAAILTWLVLEAGTMANTSGFVQSLSATQAIIIGTPFGRLVAAQVAMLLMTGLALGGGDRLVRWWLAALFSAIATALQAGHGHAMAMYDGPSLLLFSGVLHLLAAGAWLGGLLPLTLALRILSPQIAGLVARRFSPLGQICVAGLVVSAGYQYWVMIGGIPGLVGTAYGWMVLVKSLLLIVLLAIAATNRYCLVPSLLRTRAESDLRLLQYSIVLETGVALLVVMAAAVLTNLPPAMHIQPVWPFSEQFSLIAIQEDPSFRMEVVETAAAPALICALLVTAVLARRLRWATLVGAAVLAWFTIPHLDLFFVTAYPTSFYHSTTGFSADAIANGAALYPQHCAGCHGTEGRGEGPDAKGLPIPPADLTAEHLWAHSDGELFWWLSEGIEAPEGGWAMPGFSAVLSEDERWDLIDYIRAHNAGLALSRTGSWSPPLQAPNLAVTCGDRPSSELQDWHGHVLRLVFASEPKAKSSVLPSQGRSNQHVMDIWVTDDGMPPAGMCTAADPDAWRAYAIVSGTTASDLPGTQFLIDGAGFLRLIQRPSEASPGWDDPKVLERASQMISAHPISDAHAAMHHHH